MVDDEDAGFQQFRKSGFEWYKSEDQQRTYSGHALYRYTTFAPQYFWENWAFWVGNIQTEGKYEVKVWVPNIPLAGGEETTEEAIYRVYHKGGQVDVPINQTPHGEYDENEKGWWMELGEYTFEEGSKAAVRLIDEVEDENEHGKVIWADAIKWDNVGYYADGFHTDGTSERILV